MGDFRRQHPYRMVEEQPGSRHPGVTKTSISGIDIMKNKINQLLENEIQYKKQIKSLENDSQELLGTYNVVYEENRVLRSIVEHGTDATRLKKLNQENSKLRKSNNELLDEVKTLKSSLLAVETEQQKLEDDELDKQWKAALETGKKKQEKIEKDTRQRRRGKYEQQKKKEIVAEMANEDEIDLRIDTLEKQTLILHNNIKQLMSEKYQVKFAIVMDKGSVTKNPVMSNALNEKLNRDLNTFEERLNELNEKHKTLKFQQGVITNKLPKSTKKMVKDRAEEAAQQEATEDVQVRSSLQTNSAAIEGFGQPQSSRGDKGQGLRAKSDTSPKTLKTQTEPVLPIKNQVAPSPAFSERLDTRRRKSPAKYHDAASLNDNKTSRSHYSDGDRTKPMLSQRPQHIASPPQSGHPGNHWSSSPIAGRRTGNQGPPPHPLHDTRSDSKTQHARAPISRRSVFITDEDNEYGKDALDSRGEAGMWTPVPIQFKQKAEHYVF